MSTINALLEKSENIVDNWQLVQTRLRSSYGEATYKSWLSKLEFVNAKNGQVTLAAPTRFIREWVITHYGAPIKNIWHTIDNSVFHLDIVVSEQISLDAMKPNVTTGSVNSALINENLKPAEPLENILTSTIDERYSFDNFIVGPSNELAYAAAKSVAEADKVQSELNPLFLYGGVGLGKTHLMHSIACLLQKNNSGKKVVYMSAEKFMYQFVKALRDKSIMSFKEEFRAIDILMIDDVQFICGKDSTQQEFFHTFNALIDNNRQMVISCDRSPSDLDGMEDRIKSRLGWGLVVDVHSTTYELRVGILESKAQQMNVTIPQNVIEFLAAKITSNVRELEGALNKVVAHSTLIGRAITLEGTQEILRDLLRSNERIVSIDEIQKKVAAHFNVRVADMSSPRRIRTIARPRQIAMYLAKNLTPRSLVEIGKKFGGKDHTTVMHAVKTVKKLALSDQEFANDLQLITNILQS
jgi:chromosomal replication initiator protein